MVVYVQITAITGISVHATRSPIVYFKYREEEEKKETCECADGCKAVAVAVDDEATATALTPEKKGRVNWSRSTAAHPAVIEYFASQTNFTRFVRALRHMGWKPRIHKITRNQNSVKVGNMSLSKWLARREWLPVISILRGPRSTSSIPDVQYYPPITDNKLLAYVKYGASLVSCDLQKLRTALSILQSEHPGKHEKQQKAVVAAIAERMEFLKRLQSCNTAANVCKDDMICRACVTRYVNMREGEMKRIISSLTMRVQVVLSQVLPERLGARYDMVMKAVFAAEELIADLENLLLRFPQLPHTGPKSEGFQYCQQQIANHKLMVEGIMSLYQKEEEDRNAEQLRMHAHCLQKGTASVLHTARQMLMAELVREEVRVQGILDERTKQAQMQRSMMIMQEEEEEEEKEEEMKEEEEEGEGGTRAHTIYMMMAKHERWTFEGMESELSKEQQECVLQDYLRLKCNHSNIFRDLRLKKNAEGTAAMWCMGKPDHRWLRAWFDGLVENKTGTAVANDGAVIAWTRLQAMNMMCAFNEAAVTASLPWNVWSKWWDVTRSCVLRFLAHKPEDRTFGEFLQPYSIIWEMDQHGLHVAFRKQ